ncbi:hypothetical protein F5Y14DRAFT_450380 [Nemania sp. NC0429]|nr:hypothetical protein F5Y14DRAFT_450380 [Nemania sp. NC0429]
METLRYVCDAAGDLDLVVRERDYGKGGGGGGGGGEKAPFKRAVVFRVSRACLRRYTSLLDANATGHGEGGSEREGSRLVIDDESITAVKVWMDALHRRGSRDGGAIGISDAWWAIHFGNKYLRDRKQGAELDDEDGEEALKPAKDMSLLAGWFTAYYNKHDETFEGKGEEKRRVWAFSVLAPAYWFDCPQIFHDVTKYLVYNTTGSIVNVNPTRKGDRYMRGVPERILGQLSAARASQRTRLEKLLPVVSAPIPEHKGECLDVMTFSHKRSLLATGIKSLFSLADRKRTLKALLDDLDEYKFTLVTIKPCPGSDSWSTEICSSCIGGGDEDQKLWRAAYKLTEGVLDASERVRGNFGGLCLDCMHKFKNGGDDDDDYFAHDRPGNHDRGCRVRHGQPTWYFSYMGRRELMVRHQARRVEKREERKKNNEEQMRRFALFIEDLEDGPIPF